MRFACYTPFQVSVALNFPGLVRGKWYSFDFKNIVSGQPNDM